MSGSISERAEFQPLLAKLARLRQNVESVFLGKPRAVWELLVALLSRGHVLIEDVPGVGKTVLARALARSLDCSFTRIQLTPDLLPTDILGVSVYSDKSGSFEYKRGPIFANVVLADEINRTTPRTQSALLEAMNEAQVSVDGMTRALPLPFMIIATQNPFEYEGTYFLPENQLDRFTLRVRIGYPGRADEIRIVRQQPAREQLDHLQPVMQRDEVMALQDLVDQVRVEPALEDYVLNVVQATREHPHLEIGVSPRGTLALVKSSQASALLAGRGFVIPDDIKEMVLPVFAHRVVSKSYAYDGHVGSNEQIVAAILEEVPSPS